MSASHSRLMEASAATINSVVELKRPAVFAITSLIGDVVQGTNVIYNMVGVAIAMVIYTMHDK